MSVTTHIERRGELQTYFDRTAVDAWARLTSDAPVGRIRATVRAGRDEPERIGEVLAEALDDDGLEVWFRLPATDAWADATGRIGEPPMDTVRARTPVRRGDLELGLVLHDPALADTPDTREGVIRAAGLAMEIARLRGEVRVQLAQVQSLSCYNWTCKKTTWPPTCFGLDCRLLLPYSQSRSPLMLGSQTDARPVTEGADNQRVDQSGVSVQRDG